MAARAVRQECKHRHGEKKGGCVCCGRAELSRGCVGPPTFLWGNIGDDGGPVICVACSVPLHVPGVLLCACIRSSASQGRANPILDIRELGHRGPTLATPLASILRLKTSGCRRQRLGGRCPTCPRCPTAGGMPPSPTSGAGGLGCGGTLCEHPRGDVGCSAAPCRPHPWPLCCRRTFQGGWRGASAAGQGKGPFMEAFLH